MKKNIVAKSIRVLKEEGIESCILKTRKYVEKKMKERKPLESRYKDVLFISGCNEDLPHPWRYRVSHQREQLEAFHVTTDEVYFQDLKLDQIRGYRAFVFFRCPYTEKIGEFVLLAKQLNKKLIYDIDDLVVDTKYTNQIPFVQKMKAEDKKAYDENVMKMQQLLRCCDIAVTSTNCLCEELKKYISTVYINRNTASEEMVKLSQNAIIQKQDKKDENVRIGYFSGSITHNADFKLILPAIAKVMKKHQNVELYLVGEVDIPKELQNYTDRIKKLPFGDWRELPTLIATVDINLAPLEDTIFNKAKSENKWVEAALVKVVTVASDIGAFHDCIENGITGFLCKNEREWEDTLENLIRDSESRENVAKAAYNYCIEHCTTMSSGEKIAQILEKEIKENYGFVLPGLEISGGIKVALKHASILQKNGKDVTLFLLDGKEKWCEFEGRKFPVINLNNTEVSGNIGYAIATMWTTVSFIDQYPNIKNRYYLVQNYETDFYKQGDELRIKANQSYMPYHNVEFITISRWCEKWLLERYGKKAKYVPNGIDIENFQYHKRVDNNKIRILIEGDCAVDYKNVDEAFKIVKTLDSEIYEIWYMSYNAKPKEWYRVDRFLHKVPYAEVPDIYSQCDILLKTSLLESFSYPPLEMMATGGYVVVVPNGGNIEYLRNNENCLFYTAGNVDDARNAICKIVNNEEVREKLYRNGRQTAESRAWEKIEQEILNLYS